jgi:ADP-L-glycero-D-manno-heptose 6-epimerase
MIVVTGGAGFIGSNIVRELNLLGETEILIVDSLKSSPNPAHPKFLNLISAKFADFMDKREFRAALAAGRFERQRFRAIFHNGACSDTLEDDGQYIMCNNFTYSKELLHFATEGQIPLIYASSAAIRLLQASVR